VVGLHVEVPMSAEVERNDLRLAGPRARIASSITRPDGVAGSGAGTIPCTRRPAIAISRLPNGRDSARIYPTADRARPGSDAGPDGRRRLGPHL
jgi:hypothetical protein